MGKRPFVRFYHMDWASSGDVQDMSMEEVGVYWTLLVRQMVDGNVNMDRTKLRRVLNVDTVEEVDNLLTPKVMSKFVEVPDQPGRMYNRRLIEVIVETDAASSRNQANVRSRYEIKAPPISAGFQQQAAPSQVAPDLDYAPVLMAYPKTMQNGPGWDEGVSMMRALITTEEQLQTLLSAVKAYAAWKKKPTNSGQSIKKFDSFMTNWESWIPKNHRSSHVEREVSPTPSTTPAGSPAPKKRRCQLDSLAPGEQPPWIPDESLPESIRKDIVAHWTEEKKQQWLYPDEHPDTPQTEKVTN